MGKILLKVKNAKNLLGKNTVFFTDDYLKIHNQKAYVKVANHLRTNNVALVVHATGTGKSTLPLTYLSDIGSIKKVKALYVSPATNLNDQFERYCKNNIGESKDGQIELETCCYAGLGNKVKSNYDVIIFDEVHRAGAEKWGENAQKLRANNPNAKVLGLTATLERDDGVDVKELFDNQEPISVLNLIEAIKNGILPMPNYVMAQPSFSDKIKIVDDQIAELKKAMTKQRSDIVEGLLGELYELRTSLQNADSIQDVFGKELDTESLRNGKYIVFCEPGYKNLDDEKSLMQTMEESSLEWFTKVEGNPTIKTFRLHSKYNKKVNDAQLKAFEEDKSEGIKLLFSVNMLNEGKHVKDIDGIIMLRPTNSRIIFLQQLGRALSVGGEKPTKIFDFVANLDFAGVEQVKEFFDKVTSNGKLHNHEQNEGNSEEKVKLSSFTIKNLSTLEFFDKVQDKMEEYEVTAGFEEIFKRLVKYKAENGHLLVPQNYVEDDGYTLGSKVKTLRVGYKRKVLSEKQIQRLNEIGFVWDVFDHKFEKLFERLVKYKEKYGDLLVPVSYVDENGYKLGKKVKTLRVGYKRKELSEKQIQRLNEIGFVWDVFDHKFEKLFERLVKYKEKYGDLLVPVSYVDENGYKLGKKVNTLRVGYKRKELSEKQIQRLNEIGFVWSVRNIKTKKEKESSEGKI